MQKRISYVFLFVLLIALLSLSQPIKAENIDLDKIQDYLELSQLDARNILKGSIKGLGNEWENSIVSPGYTAETGAILILAQKSIQVDALSSLLVEIPIKTLKTVYKTVLFFNNDPGIYDLLGEFEKFTVEQARKYALEWLFQEQIKIGTGNLSIDYAAYGEGAEHILFPYVLTYMPMSADDAEVDIKIYSANPIKPPKPTYNYQWLGNDGDEISPFIIHIKGRVQKAQFYTYKWLGEPDITIEFSNDVPQLNFGNMSMVSKTEENVIKGIGILNKSVDIAKNIVDKIKDSTTLVFNKIKSIVSGNTFSGGVASSASQSEFLPELARPLDMPDSSSQSSQQTRFDPPSPPSHTQPETNPKTEPKPLSSNVQGKIDEISRQIALITQRINALKMASEEKQVLGETDKANEVDKIEEKEEENVKTSKELPLILIGQVCAGMDRAGNEFIQLYNPNNFSVSLNDNNFGLKLVSSSNKISKKKITWSSSNIPAKGYFLLSSGDLIINGQRLNPDASFNSQMTSVSGAIVVDGNDKIIDRVAWGKADKPAPDSAIETRGVVLDDGLKTGQGLERRSSGNGLVDTDNNSQDFLLKDELEITNSLGQKLTYKKAVVSNNSSQYSSYTGNSGSGGNTPNLPKPAPEVLITEIGIIGSDDFVELYNPTNINQDLDGCKLRKKIQSGADYSLKSIPEGVVIAPGQYLLWASSKNDYHLEVNAELFTQQILSSDYSVALISDGGDIVDAVAWGEGHINPYVEGSAFPENPDSGQTIGRKWDAGSNTYQNTGNNANDFELQFSTPRAQNQVFRDIIASDTEIISSPAELTNKTIAEFTFSASENGCSFECQLDVGGDWQDCQSPKNYSGLSNGEHSFSVHAIDEAGNIDNTPAEYSWEIDITAPITTIVLKPLALANQTQANFTFSASEDDCSFECQLDGGIWQNCQMPLSQTYDNLLNGEHSFSVRATDVVGNIEIEPVNYNWTIDTSIDLPVLILSDMDSDSEIYTNQLEISVSIENDDEAIAWFLSELPDEPLLDSDSWLLTRPEQATLSVGDNVKTIYLWTKDVVGNISQSASDSIILDMQLPVVEFNSVNSIQDALEFDISWAGQDSGSGIGSYDLKIWEDSALEPDTWQTISVSTYEFTGENGKTYNFKVRAIDNAGNLSESTNIISTQVAVPVLSVLPSDLIFEAIEYGDNPDSQNITIQNTGFGSLEWEIAQIAMVEPEVDWLILNTDNLNGVLVADELVQVDVNIDTADLAVVKYSAELEISSNNGSTIVGVTLNILPDITPPSPPTGISPVSGQTFTYSPITIFGKAEPNALVLISSGEIQVSEIRVDEEENWEAELFLTEGENQFDILVQDEAGNTSGIVEWQCFLVIPSPVLVVSLFSLSFSAEQDGDNPAPVGMIIQNTGTADMAWQAEYVEDWIVFESNDSGVLIPGGTFEIEVLADITGLSAGEYDAEVIITAPDADNSPQTVQINLEILEPASPPEYSLLDVVINEIAWMGTEAQHQDEWIELYNNTESEIDFSGWLLTTADSGLEIALTGEIFANGFYVIERTNDTTVSDIDADWYGSFGDGLNNAGEKLELKDGTGNLIDSVDCSSDWFAGDNGDDDDNDEKMTMERIDSTTGGSDSENWADNNPESASNGFDASGNSINGTPGQENSEPTELEPEPEPFEPVSFFWSQFQKDSFRTGYAPVSGPENVNKSKVIFNDSISDIITDQESTIYFAGLNGIYCFDADFKEKWVLDEKEVVALAGADNGMIFAIAGRYGCKGKDPDSRCGGKLIGLDQAGNKHWEYMLSTLYSELKPVVFGDRVYITNRCAGEIEFSLFAFDFNGNLDWAFDPTDGDNGKLYQTPNFTCGPGGRSGSNISSPAIGSDGTIYFGGFNTLYSVSSAGVLKWKKTFDVNNYIGAPSIGPDSTIYVTTDKLLALDPETGNTLWEFASIGRNGRFGPSFGADGTLYVWGWFNGAWFHALSPGIVEPENRALWGIDPSNIGTPGSLSAILVVQNAIYFTSNNNPHATVWAVNFNQEFTDFSEKEIWRFNTQAGPTISHLAVSPNGTIFVPGRKLYAISP